RPVVLGYSSAVWARFSLVGLSAGASGSLSAAVSSEAFAVASPFLSMRKRQTPVFGFPRSLTAQKPVHGGNENQSCNRRKQKTANHSSGKRRVLFATLTNPKGHRDHAEDHRACGHQDGP